MSSPTAWRQTVCIAAVLGLDLWAGDVFAAAALYALPVLLPRSPSRGMPPGGLAFVCTSLIVLGFYVHGATAASAIGDRLVALASVWAAAAARRRAESRRAASQRSRAEVGELARRLEQTLAERDRVLADTEARARVLMSVMEDLAQEVERRASAEASLETSRARARAILDNAPDAILTVDHDGRVTGWNPAAERFGWTEQEALGRRIDDLIALSHAEDGRAVALEQLEAGGDGSARRALWARTRGGERVPVEVSVVPVPIGDRLERSAFVEDVSERQRMLEEQRELSERLQAAVDSLRASNAELEKFAYVASHDLQTPLRSIAGFAQILREDYADALDDAGRAHLGRIVASVARMQALIQALLAYSRVESRPMRTEMVELDGALDEALALLERGIAETGAVVRRSPLPCVPGDRVLLVQLFQNLVGNALKYRGDRPPVVTIGARADAGGWTLSVRDEGIGIDPRHHERIFEIFRRLHAEDDVEGTGIGLAICRRVAALHHGRIWVESEPGRGAEFLVHLPGRRPSKS